MTGLSLTPTRLATAIWLGVCVLLSAFDARALDPAESSELQDMIAAGIKPQTIQLNDAAIQYYRHPEDKPGPHEFLVISRGDHMPIKVAAQRFSMRSLQVGGTNAPNAIYVGYSGGEHCCFTAYLVWIERELRFESIDLADSDLAILAGGTGLRLSFRDMAFASWNAPFAKSPAPTVLLAYDRDSRNYDVDSDDMRKPPPDAAALAQQAAAIRKTYETLPEGQLDPSLWAAMLDLIYSGNADVARRLLDDAWPPNRPGEDQFLTDFSKQLWQGAIWRRFDLGGALGAEAAFPRIGGKP
jgi:hypothetical protein